MAAARGYLYGGDSGGGFNSVELTNNNKRVSCCSSSSKPLDSFFVSGSSHFGGSRSMVSFEDNRNGSSGSFFRTFDHEENGDDEYDDYFQHPAEKKRRLKADQVEFLEKSFEIENKLEPERKIQLAKDLGLQPRQIAIWFQNRRARWKTKQLEKDYDVLQESYNQLKANYDNLLQEKEKLKSQVLDLSDKLLVQQQTEKGTCEHSSSTTKSPPSQPLQQEPVADCVNDERHVSNGAYVQDVLSESSSQKYIDGPISIGDSSYLFDQDHSDESLDEEDNLEKMFVTPVVSGYMLPKIENDEDYPAELDAVNSCYLQLGFHGNYNGHSDHDHQDQSFGFWSY